MDVGAIIATAITATGGLVAAYWQWVYKPKREQKSQQSAEGRAIDHVFEDLERLRGLLATERRAHRVTREEYISAIERLARLETEAKFLRAAVIAKDEAIAELRAEVAAVRAEIAEMRNAR